VCLGAGMGHGGREEKIPVPQSPSQWLVTLLTELSLFMGIAH